MSSIAKRVSEKTGRISWVVRYRTPDGGSREKSFKLKREASDYLTTVEGSKLVGGYIDPRRAKILTGDWASKWLATKTNLAATTRGRYEDIDRAYIQPRWGNVPLSKVTHEDIQEWLAGLPLAAASVRKVHRNLSQLLDYAVRSGRLAVNPAKGCSLPRVKSKPKRYLTHEEVAAFADAVGPDWRLVVLTLAYTGLRFGELAALRARNLDLLRRRVIVCESYSPVNSVMVLSDTKGHQRRDVPLPRFLVPELQVQLAGKGPDSLVFTGPKGAILRSQTLQQSAFKKASLALGLCHQKLDDDGNPVLTKRGKAVMTGFLSPHELRHTAASLAIAAGADVKVVQQMLGHKSATMTLDQYGHLFPDRLDIVSDAMDAAREAGLSSRVDSVLTSDKWPSTAT